MSRGGRFKSENAAGNWTHPRDLGGRFRPKFSHSIRASTRSVSYNAGMRIPIVPKRLTLYTGALIRVERTSTAPGLLSGLADAGVDKAVKGLGGGEGVTKLGAALKGEQVMIGGVQVQRSAILQSPTIRASQRTGGTSRRRAPAEQMMTTAATGGGAQVPKAITAGPARSPNRKARTTVRRGSGRPQRRGTAGKKV